MDYETMEKETKRGRKPVLAPLLLSILPGQTIAWPGKSHNSVYHVARKIGLSGRFMVRRGADGQLYVARKREAAQ